MNTVLQFFRTLHQTKEMMIERFEAFHRYVAQVSPKSPFQLDAEKAEGIYVYDRSGKQYIDLLSGISVCNVGHRHPKVLDAIRAQMDKYLHVMVYGEFVQQPQLELAQLLASVLPAQLQKTFFVNSGSEAIEGAIKLARRVNKRSGIVAFRKSYHGSTLGVVSVMGAEEFRAPFRPLLPDVTLLNFNCEEDLSQINQSTSCVIVEPVQAGAGIILPQNNFLQKLSKRCKEVGALLIFDEIQTGFGRTGKLFGFENFDVVPDILCIAKGMGAGMPIGAFISSEKLMEYLNDTHPLLGHATTFGGHPLSCVAAKANLEIILSENLPVKANAKGEYLRKELLQHPAVKDVRGIGLFMALELNEPEKTKKLIYSCISNGLITYSYLFNPNAVGIAPPLVITQDEMEEVIRRMKKALDEIIMI